ncbi:hypothetical protein [Kitasatospora sp. GP82]|uniref:arsenate reductase/protein-tyrosine-phosphatase family protein n=1 Tax=Kitasatospora sp. GP82 TaxID=3035089 RepID=UPI0024746128|nr:hypothetical protein [Kitasatospora sp. GP82]
MCSSVAQHSRCSASRLPCPALALSVPALTAGRRSRLLLFVCGANTCRSAMAEAVARAELAALPPGFSVAPLRVASAGLSVAPGGRLGDG